MSDGSADSVDSMEAAGALSRTGIVIVNWNSWGDVLETLESVVRMRGFCGPVIICDNASSDCSVEHLQTWARGELCALPENRDFPIADMVVPPSGLPMECKVVDAGAPPFWPFSGYGCPLLIIRSSRNLGFAGGNNLGMRWLEACPEVSFFWLLNPDALPSKNAYLSWAKEVWEVDEPVIFGTVLLEYWQPEAIQACGASISRCLYVVSDNLKGMPARQIYGMGRRTPVDYPVGASLIVNRKFLNQVGLMSEDYFLYFEELDWVRRSGRVGQAFVVPQSIVYHKGGMTTKAGSGFIDRSALADYHFLRSRTLFARRFGRWGGAGAVAPALVSVLRRLLVGKWSAGLVALRASINGFLGRP